MVNEKELKDIIFTIERLMQDRQGINEEIKRILEEAEEKDIPKKVIRMIIKRRGMDKSELEEEDHLLEEYEALLNS